MAVPLWWISRQINWLDQGVPFALRVGVLALAIAVGAVSFVMVAWPGGRTEFHALAEMLPERLFRLLPQFLQSRG